jgi:hypothetical protein
MGMKFEYTSLRLIIQLTSIFHSDKELLERYGLKSNDAILAEEKHLDLYDEITTKYHPKYLAGGAAQNSARGAQVCRILQIPVCV